MIEVPGSARPDLLSGVLFTDQYQLSMAQLYHSRGLHDTPAQFDFFFRRYPDYGTHQAGYCIAAGLDALLEWMANTRFTAADLEVMAGKRTARGEPFYSNDFLAWLAADGSFERIRLRAVPEGRVVHPHVPIVVAEGPLAMAQILETALLNHLNYPTLVATKAARVVEAAHGGTVLEFGIRRGPEAGSHAGVRAALIGGASATSHVALSAALGIDAKGTHAHSMVQVFMASGAGELEAFRAFADLYPDDCVLLVDTIDTLTSGVPNAIVVFEELRAAGHRPAGIRLDSGDLAHLAIQSAARLDAAGFPDVAVVLSGDLDELAIWQILTQIDDEGPTYGVDPATLRARLVYGVGTRLISSHGHPALDGVYKLVALKPQDRWLPAIKVSETPEKVPTPGDKRVWRIYDDRGLATADLVAQASETLDADQPIELFHPHRPGVSRVVEPGSRASIEALLVDVFADGARLAAPESLDTIRRRRAADLARLDSGVRRLVNPHIYHVSLSRRTKELQHRLVREAEASVAP